MRRFDGGRLVLATHNKGKLAEFRDLLAPYGVEIVSAAELNLPEPEENGVDFRENALIKAHAAAKAAALPALADDSGLCVTVLGGKPGLYSSRWGGPEKDFFKAMRRVHEELGAASDRSAYFLCVLALVWPDGHEEIVEGRCEGNIVWPLRGAGGHGYDPCFQPKGESRTFAEMDAEEKHALSHRGRALRDLLPLFEKA